MSEPSYTATVEAPQNTAAVVEQIIGIATVRTERATATAVAKVERAIATAAAVQGLAGAEGKQGNDGPRGPSGNVTQAFYHRQIEPALLWVVNHNLGLMPAITAVVSLGGLEILADVQHVSDNQLRVAFVEPTAGQLRCI